MGYYQTYDWKVSARSGGFEVVASGIVQSFGRADVTVEITGISITVRLVYDAQGTRWQFHPGTSPTHSILYLYNFPNGVITGPDKPVIVGEFGDGKKIALSIAAHIQRPEVPTIIFYTFYAEIGTTDMGGIG